MSLFLFLQKFKTRKKHQITTPWINTLIRVANIISSTHKIPNFTAWCVSWFIVFNLTRQWPSFGELSNLPNGLKRTNPGDFLSQVLEMIKSVCMCQRYLVKGILCCILWFRRRNSNWIIFKFHVGGMSVDCNSSNGGRSRKGLPKVTRHPIWPPNHLLRIPKNINLSPVKCCSRPTSGMTRVHPGFWYVLKSRETTKTTSQAASNSKK